MSCEPLTCEIERLPDGLLRVGFAGTAGIGSEGNPHGAQICEVLMAAIAERQPPGLVVDFRRLHYEFGDYIGGALLRAYQDLGSGRICVVAMRGTARALESLWDCGPRKLPGWPPTVSTVAGAAAYLTRGADAPPPQG